MSLELTLQQSIKEFEERFSNVLACYDAHQMYSALTALATLEHGGFPPDVLAALDQGNTAPAVKFQAKVFLTLLDRGALVPFQVVTPMTSEAQREIDAMEILVGNKTAPVPKKNPQQQREDQLAECAEDYKGKLSTREFKAKWMGDPKRREVYEQAIAAGKI